MKNLQMQKSGEELRMKWRDKFKDMKVRDKLGSYRILVLIVTVIMGLVASQHHDAYAGPENYGKLVSGAGKGYGDGYAHLGLSDEAVCTSGCDDGRRNGRF